MKHSKVTIEEFMQGHNYQIREILDNLSGLIYQQFPNIKEKISYSKLTYSDAELGKIIQIKPNHNKIHFELTKQKKEIIILQEEFENQLYLETIKSELNNIKNISS